MSTSYTRRIHSDGKKQPFPPHPSTPSTVICLQFTCYTSHRAFSEVGGATAAFRPYRATDHKILKKKKHSNNIIIQRDRDGAKNLNINYAANGSTPRGDGGRRVIAVLCSRFITPPVPRIKNVVREGSGLFFSEFRANASGHVVR